MAFHDTQLPVQVEKGASGGPMFKTTVLALANGHERRNIDWAATRASYDVSYGIQEKEDFDDIIAFFYARQGRAHSFRFKDWTDFELTAQQIGATDAATATFQIYKDYTSGATTFARTLYKPLGSGWVVTVNAVSQTVLYDNPTPGTTDVAINTLTGVLTLGATHVATSGHAIVVTGEYDVAVRFNTDALSLSAETWNAAAIPALPLVEVRGE
jgi:uncharacterized protein (TIGR02217 family)